MFVLDLGAKGFATRLGNIVRNAQPATTPALSLGRLAPSLGVQNRQSNSGSEFLGNNPQKPLIKQTSCGKGVMNGCRPSLGKLKAELSAKAIDGIFFL
jgi:hypothetical protein